VEDTPFVDQRRSPRFRETNPLRLAIASEDYRAEYDAITTDHSLHGARIRTNISVSPGEIVEIIPEGDPELRITARVVWMRGAEPNVSYFEGLEFLKPMTVPQLRRMS